MVARALYAIDSEALTVLYSTAQSVGDTVINNSDSPNGTQYTFGAGYSTLQVIVEDTGGSADTLEDDNHTSHIVTDGAGLVANGTGIEAESVIQLQEMSASGIPIGPVINIYVLSQNGVTADVWGFVSDTMLAPGTNYQKVGGGNIGSTDYANFQTPWLVTVDGTVGNDVMGVGYTDVDGDQIDGSDGNNDAIYGYGGNDTITAGAGNDTLVGGTGADSLDGGTGTDVADYSTSSAAVTVNLVTGTGAGGDAQGDTLTNIENLTGSGFNDNLTGDGNANLLRGGGGNDSLQGGAGNDTLVGGAGADSLTGGLGIDLADYSESGAGITVNLANGTGTGGDAQGDTLAGIENLTGSDFNDRLTGDANANVLSGGAGQDTLTGGAGADTLDGGIGTDRADYSASSAAVTVNLATGIGTGGDAQGDTLSNIENLTGSKFNDSLTGDGNANAIDGGGGADTLVGGAGSDTLTGAGGADSID
ncbi:MAG: calcium-binding protein, partial [Sulfitobacter sp.]|nr:calcium-binding protein [Sulfitobacter sp.]